MSDGWRREWLFGEVVILGGELEETVKQKEVSRHQSRAEEQR